MSKLVTESTAAVMFIAVMGLIGLGSFAAAIFCQSWIRSLQAWRFRRDQRKLAERDEDDAATKAGAEFLSDLAGH